MSVNIAFIFVFFIEMLISCIFFSNLSDKKHSLFTTICIGTVLFEFGALLNIFLISNALLNVAFSIFVNYVFATVFFDIKKLRNLYYSVLLTTVSAALEVICILVSSSVNELYASNFAADLYYSDYQAKILSFMSELILSKVLYFLFVIILMRFIKGEENKVKVPVSFYIYPFVVTVSTVLFWFIIISEQVEYNNQIILATISILLFVSTIFLFFAYQAHAQKENQMLLLQQEQDKIKTDITYYDILEQQNNNLRAYAHDTKNHLSAIKNLNTNPEIEMHISKMSESLAEYSKVCHSGNHTLDVVIDKYVAECKINGLSFEFDIKNNNLSKIEPYDIVTILGNLLDNAVEAAVTSTGKSVIFETDYRNDFSVIIISNSCDSNPMSDGRELPVTTKSNKRLHGFGLKSVKNTVKKYNGDIAFDYDEKTKLFVVTVMIEKSQS